MTELKIGLASQVTLEILMFQSLVQTATDLATLNKGVPY